MAWSVSPLPPAVFGHWGVLPATIGHSAGMDFDSQGNLYILNRVGEVYRCGQVFGFLTMTLVDTITNRETFTSMTIVPEPATMLVLGGSVLALIRRRRR